MNDLKTVLSTMILGLLCVIPCVADFSPNWVWDDFPYSGFGWFIAQTPDGDTQVVGSRLSAGFVGGCLAAFDWKSDIPIIRWTFPETPVEAVAITDDGTRIAFSVPGMLYVVDRSGEVVWEHNITSAGYPRSLDFDPSGDLLVLAVDDGIGQRVRGRVLLFDGMNGDLFWTDIPEQHGSTANVIRKLQISDNGRWIFGSIATNSTPGPTSVIMYDLLGQTPDIPIYIAETDPRAQTTHADLATAAEFFVINASTWFEYHDFSDPVGGIKIPKWEVDGEGYEGLGSKCAVSSDGSIAAYHGAGLNSVSGYARVFQGADGTELFSMSTEFMDPEVTVSGDGSRAAFSGDLLDYPYEQGFVYVWDRTQNDLLCELSTFGPVCLDFSGKHLFVGSGRDEDQVTSRPSLFRLEDNDPPACSISSPGSGTTATSTVTLFGIASDPENALDRIEIHTSQGILLADPVGTQLETWQAVVDLSDVAVGAVEFRARSIDDRHKHGDWDSLELIILPTPTPTATPDVTPTPNLPEPINLELTMPQKMFQAGDVFSLDATVFNKEITLQNAPFYVLLEIHGLFFAAPSWQFVNGQSSVDFLNRTFPEGISDVEILPEFIWPDTDSSDAGLVFYGLILDPESNEIASNLDFIVWGYR